MEELFIALVPTAFSRIQIQTTVFLKEGKTYVNSVNIIYEGIILDKIKQERPIELKSIDPDKIASDYILKKLNTKNIRSKPSSTPNKKKAANTIRNEFNL